MFNSCFNQRGAGRGSFFVIEEKLEIYIRWNN